MSDDQGRRILVTGASGALAGGLLQQLEADERVAYLGSVDLDEPRVPLERTEFIRGDLRNPLVAKVVESTGVDTLVHLGVIPTPTEAGGRSRMKELNVIGTMQLLAAAEHAPSLRQVVVRSSTAVYGSHYRDPALLREDMRGAEPPTSGYGKDTTDIEGYARALGRRRPDLTLSVMRLANTVGPTVDTPLTRYLRLPVPPTVLGYDPRMQLLHEDDAVEALRRACLDAHPGVYNVAGPGVLYLSQVLRIAGRAEAPMPRPLAPLVAASLRSIGHVDFSADQLNFLLFGRVADITRLRHTFGFTPAYDTRAALVDFLTKRGLEPLVSPERVAALERRLLGLVHQRTRPSAPAGGERR